MSKAKKKSSAAKKVAVFFVVLIIIEILAIFGINKVFKNDDVTPSFAGYSVFLMDSKEMGKDVPVNTLVLTEEVSPSKDKIGKAVLCENVPGIGTSVFWLADVESKGENLTGVVYKVYQGDSEKIYTVNSKDVVGVAKKYYSTAGKIIKFVKTRVGMAICVAIPLLLMIFLEIIIAIARHASSKNYDDDDYDDDDYDDDSGDALESFLNEKRSHEDVVNETDDGDYDIKFGPSMRPNNVDNERYPEKDLIGEVDDSVDEVAEEAEESVFEETVEEQPSAPQKRDVEESVSSTRNTASASLEELMRMMEEEQNKLKEQLKED